MKFSYTSKLAFLALLLFSFCTTAQQIETPKDSLPTTWELLKYDGVSAFGGLKTTYTQPLKWQKDDFITAGAIVAGTAVLYIFDEETTEWFRGQEDDIPGIVKDFGWYYGSPQNNYAINGAVYLYGLFTKNEKLRRTGVLMISAASAAGLIQTISKTALGRARPGTNEGKGSFKPFSNEGAYHSFPSGHTILSFTTAYALSKQFDNMFVKAGIWGVGLIAPVSRLWSGAHWFTDVALSLALSVVVVDTIDNYLNSDRNYKTKDPDKLNITWDFKVGLGRVGLVGSF
jgi:hypothetical protein